VLLPVVLSNASLSAAPPPGLEATFRLGSAQVSPGADVRVPIFVSSNEPLAGLSISVDFDEEVLEATSIDVAFQRPGGGGWDPQYIYTDIHVNGRSNINNDNSTPGNGGVDEGYLYAAVIFLPEEGLEAFRQAGGTWEDLLPPLDVENEILAIHFRVRPDAPPGETEIRFFDNAPSVNPEVPVQNVAALLPGYSAELETQVGAVGINALLAIVDGGGAFIRGDANGDSKVDVSDPILALGFLFSGMVSIGCLDAADANDDGSFDISDPIATLSALFLLGRPLPPPSEAPGRDPTETDPFHCGV
jgi:hypothetical protein